MGNLIRFDEAADFLPFWKMSTIKNYTSRGLIPCVRLGRRVFFRKEDLEKFVNELTKEQKGSYGNLSI